MEAQLLPFNFTTILLLTSFLYLLLKTWKNSTSSKQHKNLPPSPLRLPLIGHIHHLIGGQPHHALKRMSDKYGAILHINLGEVSAILISKREATKELLKVQDPVCANRPESIGSKIMWYDYCDIVFSPDGEFWRQMRKIYIMELLIAKNVKSFGSIREDEISRLVTSLRASAGQPINLTKMVFAFTSSMTSRDVFGKVMRDRDMLIEMVKEAVTMAGGMELADLFQSSKVLSLLTWNKYKLLKMRHKLDKILDVIVDEHRGNKSGEYGGEDIVNVLLRIQKNEELQFLITNDNIKAVIFDIFSGGTETSSTAIDWAMAELMKNPHVMVKTQAEIREALRGKTKLEESDLQNLKYIKLIIRETLRMHPPVPMNMRSVRDECQADGYTIPVKFKVIVNTWAIMRDPKYWDEPNVFKPERFENASIDYLGNDFEYIPFGAGRTICPGMNFGLANFELPLIQFLYNFDWKLPQGMTPDDMDMADTAGISLARVKPLILVPTIYNPSG